MTVPPDLLPVDPHRSARDEARVRAGFWAKLRANLGRLPFARDLIAAYFCATDAATPTRVKAVLFGALAYFILPADMVPDFIAALGFTDDATVLLIALQTVRTHLKPEHYDRARAFLEAEGAAIPDDDPLKGETRSI